MTIQTKTLQITGMVTTTLLVDGMMSGTGIRDVLNGGYVEPRQLKLSTELEESLSQWVTEYGAAFMGGFSDPDGVQALDGKGLSLSCRITEELPDHVVGYYSDALMKRLDDLPHV